MVEEEDLKADPKENFRTLIRVVGKLLKDKVANVFHGALHLLSNVVHKYGPELGPKDTQSGVAELVRFPLYI
eukprot:8824869-Pyramimonas_sp.AAC.1